jgi:hypothetical protein
MTYEDYDPEPDEPSLSAAADGLVELPGGYIDEHGTIHRDAVVRELTGFDEEALDESTKKSKGNPFERYAKLLTLAVERIGDIEEVDRKVVLGLLLGDHDALIVGIRGVTYGTDLEGQVSCPECGQTSDVTIDLSEDSEDVPRKTLESPKAIYDVSLKKGAAQVRLATVGDRLALGADLTRTLSEINTALLSQCVVSIDGKDIREDVRPPSDVVRSLSAADRRTILDYMVEHQPGPRLSEVRVPCASCGVEFDAPVDLDRLLR